MAVNLSQLGSFAAQAEGSAHDIITQFLGGPSQAAVAAQESFERTQTAQAQAAAATAAAAAQAEAAKAQTEASSQQYTMIAVGVLAVILLVAVARR